MSRRLKRVPLEGARDYASFIRRGDADKRIPCWGAIRERFESTFRGDMERIQILEALIKDGAREPLFLFLESSRGRPALLKALCERAGRLPLVVQRSLIAMPEVAPLIDVYLDEFAVPAQTLWQAGEAALHRERELLAGRIGDLMAFRYFVPDAFDPREEA